jgi:hypothetical protein
MVLNHALKAEEFLALNAVCSLAAGLGLCARVAGWRTTLLAGLGLGGGLFFVNLVIGIFMGCTRKFGSL